LFIQIYCIQKSYLNNSENGKNIPKPSKMESASATIVQYFPLIIGPFADKFSFAALNSPSDLCHIFGHAHCLGIPLEWAEIFPIGHPSLLQLLPRPKYPFDLSKRFWSGKDVWANFDHPLLGNRIEHSKIDGIERFEGLVCAKRFTWMGQVGKIDGIKL
jgi:hydroxyacyl-ACP dehydratase HTD2-like protein with hotdog domain